MDCTLFWVGGLEQYFGKCTHWKLPTFFFFFNSALARLHFSLHSELQDKSSLSWCFLQLVSICFWRGRFPLWSPVPFSISCNALSSSLRAVFSICCSDVQAGWTGKGTRCADDTTLPVVLVVSSSIHSDCSGLVLHWWLLIWIVSLVIPILQVRKPI